jgi:DNA-binding NarL/FixJ family response regulator
VCPEADAPLRVLVVDDHPIWRHGVADGLEGAGCAVAGTAGDGAAALRVAAATRPSVVLLDLNLPDMSGAEVTRRLLAADPAVRVLILSASGERQDVLDAMTAGAAGYLVKSAHFSELLAAVRSTAAGEAVFTPGLAGLVLGEYRRLASGSTRHQGGPGTPSRDASGGELPAASPPEKGRPAGEGTVTPRLTDRETEVLRLVAKGMTYPEIAALLVLSPRTVQNHVQNTLVKLQLHNKAQLVRYAMEQGIG